jgi:hypothetical protein
MEARLIYRRMAVCLISLRWRVRVSHGYNGRTLSTNASWTILKNLLCWDQTRSVHQHPLSWVQWKASPTRDPWKHGRRLSAGSSKDSRSHSEGQTYLRNWNTKTMPTKPSFKQPVWLVIRRVVSVNCTRASHALMVRSKDASTTPLRLLAVAFLAMLTANCLQDQLAQHALTNLDDAWKDLRIAIERVKGSYCHNLRNCKETEAVADVTCFCKCNSRPTCIRILPC